MTLRSTKVSTEPKRSSIRLPLETLLLGLAYLGFVSLGLPDAVLGVAWPSVREVFGLPQSGLGLILTAMAVGFFVSSTLAGRLLQKLGVGNLLTLSTGLVTLALLSYVLAPSWPLFLIGAVLLGLGSGAIDAGLNAYAAGHFTARHMNWLHAAYGLGAAVGPFIMTGILAAGLSWRGGYLSIAIIMLLMSALFIATRSSWLGDVRLGSFQGGDTAGSTLRRPLVWLQVVIFFVYTGVELTVGQWTFALLTEARGLSTASAGLWAGLFWASLFAGRVALGFVADQVGPDRLVRLGTLGAVVGSLSLALAPIPVALAGLLLLGFSLAPIYPMLMSRTPARLGAEQALHAVGFQVSAAMLGGLVFPSLGGLLADSFDLEATAMLIVAAASTLWLLHEVLLRVSRKRL
jgi:fucose permease